MPNPNFTPNQLRLLALFAAGLCGWLTACQPESGPGASIANPGAVETANEGNTGPDEGGAAASSDYLSRSRELAQRLGMQLKTELQQAMADDGPAAAVGVCRERAPAIAARLSAESGAQVGRTSLRVRNPANAPLAWQRDILIDFDAQAPLTADRPPPEYHATPAAGPDAFRYLRAIPAAGLCLSCHGKTLAPGVQAALDADYPDDAATGYDAGEVRGAFVVTWPRQP